MMDPRTLPADVVAQMQATVTACGITSVEMGETLNETAVVCNAATEAAAEVLKRHAQAWHDYLEPPRGKMADES